MKTKANQSLDDILAGNSNASVSTNSKKSGARVSAMLKKASDKQSAEYENTMPSDMHTEQKEANRTINMLLNALKVWTPMLTAVASQGHAKSEEDASIDLHNIVRDCTDITTHLLQEMKKANIPVEDESHKWIVRQILANVSDTVTNQYRMKDNIDVNTTKNLLSQVIGFTTGKVPESTKEENKPLVNELLSETTQRVEDLKNLLLQGESKPINIDEEIAIQCSIIKSSEEVIANLEWFSWYSSPELHVNKFSEMVLSGAGFFYEKLLADFPVKPSRPSRVMLLQSSIDKSSRCLSAAYKKEAYVTLSAMREEFKAAESDDVKKTTFKNYQALGLPYDKINEHFERSLGLHISFTKSGAQFLKENLGGLINGAKKPKEQGRENKPS